MPGQLLAVARNAFTEAIRQPFYIVWLLVVLLGIALNPFLAAYTFEDDNKLAVDMGLSMLLMGGLFLAAFTASGVISREIENRTALTVVSKPVPRPVFVLGKFLGVAAALGLAWWDWSFLHMLAIRQGALSTASTPWNFPVIVFGLVAILGATGVAAGKNFLFNRHFGASFARWLAVLLPIAWLATLPFDPSFGGVSPLRNVPVAMLLAMFFVLQATMLFAAVATACSTRLGQVATLVDLPAGLLSGPEQRLLPRPPRADTVKDGVVVAHGAGWAKVLYYAVPNLGFHWLADALTQGTIVNAGWDYFARVTLYNRRDGRRHPRPGRRALPDAQRRVRRVPPTRPLRRRRDGADGGGGDDLAALGDRLLDGRGVHLLALADEAGAVEDHDHAQHRVQDGRDDRADLAGDAQPRRRSR